MRKTDQALRYLIAALTALDLFGMAVCKHVPIGTHYFWHNFNGLLVYLVFRGLLLNLTTAERRINL